jgi:hypothetical protein
MATRVMRSPSASQVAASVFSDGVSSQSFDHSFKSRPLPARARPDCASVAFAYWYVAM